MIIGIGLDICDIGKAKKSVEKGTFLYTYYSDAEWNFFERCGKNKYVMMAEHYAAKGAFLKLIRQGVVNADMSLVEIARDKYDEPYYNIKGWALDEMKNRGIDKITMSCTHNEEIAFAVAIAEKNE